MLVVCRLKEQDKWLHEQIEENKGEPYWDYMDALLKQFDGMVDGYQQASRDANSPDLPLLQRQDFIFVINNGELPHIAPSGSARYSREIIWYRVRTCWLVE